MVLCRREIGGNNAEKGEKPHCVPGWQLPGWPFSYLKFEIGTPPVFLLFLCGQ